MFRNSTNRVDANLLRVLSHFETALISLKEQHNTQTNKLGKFLTKLLMHLYHMFEVPD